MLYVAVVALD